MLAVINRLRWGFVGRVVSVLMLGWILSRFIAKTPLPQPDFRDSQRARA